MEVLSSVAFKGTKFYHRRNPRIEFSRSGDTWRVEIFTDGDKVPESKVMYEGNSQIEAEHKFMAGFQHHFADDYIIDESQPHEKEKLLLMFGKAMEEMYMKILGGLGYDIGGSWDMTHVFAGKKENRVDEIGIVLKRVESRSPGAGRF